MPFPVTAFMSPGGSEFLLIMLVLILLFGAKDAPRILRSIYSAMNKIQRAAASFRYKIMYGDIHSPQTDEPPYDVEASSPDEEKSGSTASPDAITDDEKSVPETETDTDRRG